LSSRFQTVLFAQDQGKSEIAGYLFDVPYLGAIYASANAARNFASHFDSILTIHRNLILAISP
jgi:hypothetical protein